MYLIRAKYVNEEPFGRYYFLYNDQDVHSFCEASNSWECDYPMVFLARDRAARDFALIDRKFLIKNRFNKKLGPVAVELLDLITLEIFQKIVDLNPPVEG